MNEQTITHEQELQKMVEQNKKMRTKLIVAIIILSLKKIPNTSLPLAPNARSTPISLFLWLIDVEIKFIRRSAANTAKPTATHTKIEVIITKISSIMSSIAVLEF